ncbi:MAG: ankyrin repeat domain-containing protein [Anaerolineales bacterium]|nr:ankyrin repeat domain-containing protein [Anaerolineales bacterium]MCB0012732.1 ankyrin repeat domain-containing protein [Anaerolineales bacterium]
MTVAALFQSIEKGDLGAAEALLAADPLLADGRLENGVSLLLMAVYYGQAAIAGAIRAQRESLDIWEAAALGEVAALSALLTAEPELLNAVAPDGFYPLGLAGYFGQQEAFRWLLAQGADRDQVAENGMRVRPVHTIAAQRDPQLALALMTDLLTYGAAVNVSQHGGWTPLHQAADHGNLALVQLLLAHGADPAAQSEAGQTPIEMAAAKEFSAVVELLNSHAG